MKTKNLFLRTMTMLAIFMLSFMKVSAQEAYAVLSSDNTTLTFYFDNLRSTHTDGQTLDLNTGISYPGWYANRESVTSVVFDSSFANALPTSCYRWFYGMSNLASITDINNLNTANVTNMSGMFYNCKKLPSLNVSGFNTDKVTSMSMMFRDCDRVKALDLSNFNTEKVTNMSQMFYSCDSLTNIVYDKSRFVTTAVNDMSSMFGWCKQLESIDVSGFNTSNVTNMHDMFAHCETLTALDVSKFNTAKVTSMSAMFSSCKQLTAVDVSGFNTDNVENMEWMFAYSPALTSLDLYGFNTSKVTSMREMFYGCSLTVLDLSSFNTSLVTNMAGMFHSSTNLTTIFVGSGWNTDAVTSSSYMFNNCTALVGGNGTTFSSSHVDQEYAHVDGGTSNPGYMTLVSEGQAYACYMAADSTLTFYYDHLRSIRTGITFDLNTGTNTPEWYDNRESITSVVFDSSFANAQPTSCYRWFCNMNNLTAITGLEYLNTDNVTNMCDMFAVCSKLTSLDVSHFNTDNVTDMQFMFSGCSGLTNLDVSHFNTANVTNMTSMFRKCSSLTSIDVSNFNTIKVTNMLGMFYECSGLTNLDMSHFNTANVISMNNMFYNCINLKTIYVSDKWSTASVTISTNMFAGCTKLVGGNGTAYNSDHVDATYAHVDGGTDNPGYFTDGRETYVLLSSDNTTLTFYYDHLRSTRTGTTFDLNTGTDNPGWYDNRESITSVVFDSSFANAQPTSCYSWFYGMENLTAITGLEYLNTANVTNMQLMFAGCNSLTNLDLSSFNTSNVTDMKYMFYASPHLTDLNISNFNTANVINMYGMFFGCQNLTSLDLSNFNTANVINMLGMFYGCTNLTSLDLSNFNTANVEYMSYMFAGCNVLTTLDLSNFNTANVIGMNNMFNSCMNLKTIYVSDKWSTASVTISTDMFTNCPMLVGGQGTAFNSDHVDATYAHVDGGTSNPGYFTGAEAYAVVDKANESLTYYYDCNKSSYTDDENMDVLGVVDNDWNSYMYPISFVTIDQSMAKYHGLTTTSGMFSGLYEVRGKIEGLRYLNTEHVVDMSHMFEGCQNLDSLDLSHFNTSQVTDMSYMFDGCSALENLDLSSFNTSQVTDMFAMFNYCSALKSVDLSSFNTSQVEGMAYMFNQCNSLRSLDLTNFNMSNVSDVEAMFYGCGNLTTIYCNDNWGDYPLSDCDAEMFFGCVNLEGAEHFLEGNDNSDWANPDTGYFTRKLLLGDVNNDGFVTIADATALVNIILGKDTAGTYNHNAADVNKDELITIADVTALVNIILGKN